MSKMLSDNYPGYIASPAYHVIPMWRQIDEFDPKPGRMWMVALSHEDLKIGDRQRSALMAFAYRIHSGWALDQQNMHPLYFVPNWFAEPPMDPPWPPSGVPMPE